MSGPRARRCFALFLSMVAGLACGDYSQSTAPLPAARKLVPTFVLSSPFSLVPRGSMAQAVRWGSAHQKADQSVSAVIGSDGGSLSLPGADFSMTIPSGALREPTTITVVAKGGLYVVYDMYPHGLKFLRPVTAVQGLSTTAIYGTPDGNFVRTAYLPAGREQIRRDDFASPSELQGATTYFSGAQPIAETQEWILNHFSRYILISGVWTEVEDDDATDTGGTDGGDIAVEELGGGVLPIGGGVLPIGGGVLPIGGGVLPIGGGALPTDGGGLPIGGGALPIGGSALPIGGSALPIGGGALPIGGGAFPIGGGAFPMGGLPIR